MKQYKQTIIQIDKIKPYAKNPKIHNSEQILKTAFHSEKL